MNDIKQFKLTSGEEIVCDVIEYPDDELADIVVKNVYQIYMHASSPDGARLYTMRPWMMMQSDPDSLVILNSNHIVGEANPSEKMIEHYAKVMIYDNGGEEQNGNDEMAEKLAAYLKMIRDAAAEAMPDSDVPVTNVVTFPGRTIH